MPNPKMPHSPIEDRFDIARGWRVYVRFENGDGYRAQLEHVKDDEWLACGPAAHSRHSAPCALQRLVDAYRLFGEAIEQRFTFESNARIGDGCPRCDYTHIRIAQRRGRITWDCPACNGHGGKPSLTTDAAGIPSERMLEKGRGDEAL